MTPGFDERSPRGVLSSDARRFELGEDIPYASAEEIRQWRERLEANQQKEAQ